MASTTSYRSQPAQQSSDSESSESDNDQPWKRQKQPKGAVAKERSMVIAPPQEQSIPSLFGTSSKGGVKRKRNNVWGEVVQKQVEEEVARDITQFDMEHSKERDVESYSFKDDSVSKPIQLGNPVSFEENVHHHRRRRMPEALGESYEDPWLKDDNKEENGDRVSVKDRLGSRNDIQKAKDRLDLEGQESWERHEDTNMRFITITPEMHDKEVAGQLAFSLQEPKRDMVQTVVYELGVEKTLEIWEKTCKIEKTGGMMVNNGSRRRTPGGVFFQLIKTDGEIPKEKKNIIFAMSVFEGKRDSRKKRRRTRQRAHMQMEVDEKPKDDMNVDKDNSSDNESDKEGARDVDVANVKEVSGGDEGKAIPADDTAPVKTEVKVEAKVEEAEMEEGEVSD